MDWFILLIWRELDEFMGKYLFILFFFKINEDFIYLDYFWEFYLVC